MLYLLHRIVPLCSTHSPPYFGVILSTLFAGISVFLLIQLLTKLTLQTITFCLAEWNFYIGLSAFTSLILGGLVARPRNSFPVLDSFIDRIIDPIHFLYSTIISKTSVSNPALITITKTIIRTHFFFFLFVLPFTDSFTVKLSCFESTRSHRSSSSSLKSYQAVFWMNTSAATRCSFVERSGIALLTRRTTRICAYPVSSSPIYGIPITTFTTLSQV